MQFRGEEFFSYRFSIVIYATAVGFLSFFGGGGRAFVERAQLAVPFRWRV